MTPRTGAATRQRTYVADLPDKMILVTTPSCASLDVHKQDGWLEGGHEWAWTRDEIATWLQTHRRAGVLRRLA